MDEQRYQKPMPMSFHVPATEFLMKVMEEFHEAEPLNMAIIYSDEAGNLKLRLNHGDRCITLGMLQLAMNIVLSGNMGKF
jgi:hypothetical protein